MALELNTSMNMRTHPSESISLWQGTTDVPIYGPLMSDLQVDVCVVGGGIAGLTTAYLLALEGKKVCVLEDFEISSGQSAKSTAQLSPVLDRRYCELESLFGRENTRLIVASHQEAINKIDEIITRERIACDFLRLNGYLCATTPEDEKILRREIETLLRAGMLDVAMGAPPKWGNFSSALRFSNQAQMNPIAYLAGLASVCSAKGVQIFCHTHVTNVHGGLPAKIDTRDGFQVTADSVVIATNSPVNNLVAIHTKQASYRTYVVAALVAKGSVEQALYWDTESPYHYVRVQEVDEERDLLLVGGEDHKTGQQPVPENCFRRLEEWTRQRFPEVQLFTHRWSGQVIEPMDGLAYIGRNAIDRNNIYVITGHSGNGMTYSTLGAMLITDLILQRSNPYEKLYEPSRIKLRAINTFLRENANTVAQYKDWFPFHPATETRSLRSGEGMVVNVGARKVAVYRSPAGGLEMHSAVCPHLGGIVRWNSVEKSWDCPCHGSRFDCHGRVIEGPAIQNLSELGPALLDEVANAY